MARRFHRFSLMMILASILSLSTSAWTFAASAPAPATQDPGPGDPQSSSGGAAPRPQNYPVGVDKGLPNPLTPKQKRGLMKDRFEKMKQQADELADLATSLQEDLSKSNENVLSLKVLEKAEKIEKLAKKIKEAARGF